MIKNDSPSSVVPTKGLEDLLMLDDLLLSTGAEVARDKVDTALVSPTKLDNGGIVDDLFNPAHLDLIGVIPFNVRELFTGVLEDLIFLLVIGLNIGLLKLGKAAGAVEVKDDGLPKIRLSSAIEDNRWSISL